MVLMKYSEILKLAKDKVQEVMAPLRANEMRKKGELEVAKMDSKIAEQEQRINELAAVYPINFDNVIEAIDELELTKRRQAQLTTIISELFDATT